MISWAVVNIYISRIGSDRERRYSTNHMVNIHKLIIHHKMSQRFLFAKPGRSLGVINTVFVSDHSLFWSIIRNLKNGSKMVSKLSFFDKSNYFHVKKFFFRNFDFKNECKKNLKIITINHAANT